MQQDEARPLIIQEFFYWCKENVESGKRVTGDHAWLFYRWLEKNRPYLLDFYSRKDKWQIVHGWLLLAGLISD